VNDERLLLVAEALRNEARTGLLRGRVRLLDGVHEAGAKDVGIIRHIPLVKLLQRCSALQAVHLSPLGGLRLGRRCPRITGLEHLRDDRRAGRLLLIRGAAGASSRRSSDSTANACHQRFGCGDSVATISCNRRCCARRTGTYMCSGRAW